MNVLTKPKCSRQKCTKYISQQGFDVPDSPTGHGEETTTNTDGDRSPDVSDTRSHCRQSTRNQTTRVRTAFRVRGSHKIHRTASSVRGVSHFTECADKPGDTSCGWNRQRIRTAQSAQRWPAHDNARCNAGWRDNAAHFQMGQPKGQLVNRFCDHHELLDYTHKSRSVVK